MSQRSIFCTVVIYSLLTALLSCNQTERSGLTPLEKMAESVTIYRDKFGVPHVYGLTDSAAAFGFAYAQAEDNFWQVEDNFVRAIGRSAEIYGEETLLDDWINRALEIPRLSIEEYEGANTDLRSLLDGFAGGLNHFLASNPNVEPRLLRQFEPWYPLALIRYLYYQKGFLYGVPIPPRAYQEAMKESLNKLPGDPSGDGAFQLPLEEKKAEQGSNSWAVTPAKSVSGHAMLLINPHLPFFGNSQVYEGHVMSKGGWNFSGYTRFGFPLPYVGFNENLGWASTDNTADLQDAYSITFDNKEEPLAYRFGTGYRTAMRWEDELVIKTEVGTEKLTALYRKTHHGPIIAIKDSIPLAVRMAKFEEPGWLDQWYRMTKSKTFQEFKAAVSRLDMLFGNYLYADNAGNILYVYNAAVPRRSEKYNWKSVLDGSDTATEWNGYHSLDEIPQLLNPESGFLQNCNGTPFLSTSIGNPDPTEFPSYMVTEGDNARHRQARQILSNMEKFTFEDWAREAYSTHLMNAENDISALVTAWEELKQTDPSRAKDIAEAVDLLKQWNGVSTVDSEAMSLYINWAPKKGQSNSRRIEALEKAKIRLERDWGTWRVPWGEINRLQRKHTGGSESFSDNKDSLPVPGAPGWAGSMFTFYTKKEKGQQRHYGTAGNTYVCVVEFGSKVKARSLHTFGASADPSSPHYFDQALRYTKGEFKTAWLTLEDVQKNAEKEYRPGR